MPYIHCDIYSFDIVNENEVFVGGEGVFAINDPKLHAMYPNFTSIEQMLKEIKVENEHRANQNAIDKLISTLPLDELKKVKEIIENLERKALIDELSTLPLDELKKKLAR